MSTLRTFNLQNPDSGTVNIEMDQGGNTLMTGIATVRGAAHFTSTSGSDAVGIGTDITAYKLDVRVTGAEAGLRVYNPDTSSNASGIIRLGNDDNQNSAFLKLNGANNSSTVGGAANLVLGTGTARQVHLATNGTSRFAVRSDGKISAGTALDVNNSYEFSIRGADGTGCLYAHGRNHYLSTRSTSHASLTLKKSNSDSDGIDYLQARDSSNAAKFVVNGNGTLQILDSIKHMGDTDTAIRFPAADTITAETGGSERVRIDSVGNMGIGGAPLPPSTGYNGATLHLYQSAGTGGSVLRMTNGNTGHTTSDGFYMGYWQDGHLYFYNQEAGHILVGTNSTERLRITSGGNIGINATSPERKLEVVDTNSNGSYPLAVSNFIDSTANKGAAIDFRLTTGGNTRGELGCKWTSNSSSDGTYFYIAPNDGSTGNIERLRITSAGKLTVTPADTTSSYATTDGGIDIAQVISSTGTSASQSIGIQFSLTKSGQTGAIAEIGAVREGSGLSALVFRTRDNSTGRNERLRITSDGELLIGETSSGGACRLGMSFGNSTGNYIEMGGTSRTANGLSKLAVMRHGYWGGAREVGSIGFLTSSSSGGAGRGSGNFVVHTGTSGNGDGGLSADTPSIERTRVDSNGRFYVNTSSATNWNQTNNSPNTNNSSGDGAVAGNMCFRTSEGALVIANDADSGYSAMYINKYEWNSGDDTRWINFYLNGSGRDSITWNGSNIVYGNNSDYRIKTNIRSYTGGIDLVKQIPVHQYDYIETERGTDHVGFIAHELQEVLPDAVSGEKDGMRIEEETGEEVMDIQNVDYGRVTPILTAALKEAIAKIEALEARIVALEG